MTTMVERAGVYGLVNGLGVHGTSREKERILASASRAANRGEWARVLELAASYGLGVYVGSLIREATRPRDW
jgi:hypothetical protein